MAVALQTFVTYYRVSTAKQGASGLGLEAQQQAVRGYLERVHGKELASFTEIESGKRNDRPKLEEAILRCRQTGATLLVSKLDRLSRDAAFLLQLRNSNLQFVCADMPEANELTIGLLAILAEHERRLISKRTKEALQAAKARGVKLGNPKIRPGDGESATTARKVRDANYAARAADLKPMVFEALKGLAPDAKPAVAVSVYFALMGVPSPRGQGAWEIRSVKRLLNFLQIPC